MAENCCETPARAADILDVERLALIREAFRLEWFTIAWMTIEAIIAIASGIAAHSISLTAFGIDSLIELASAGVLIWRLSVELKHGRISPGRRTDRKPDRRRSSVRTGRLRHHGRRLGVCGIARAKRSPGQA